MTDFAVKIINVGKKYIVCPQKPSLLSNILRKEKKKEFWALKSIKLTIKKGERVGIIGPNGAGKTTLLKIISGITTPTTGTIKTKGKVVSLIELQAGFHPELTGAENIYFNGMFIGMNREEIKKKFQRIVAFADIGKFINTPFYTYSSGMKFRLAFAVAIASEGEILIMDEIFTLGDTEFQHKTLKAIRTLRHHRPHLTTIVCSHRPVFIRSFSDTFYIMKHGRIHNEAVSKIEKLIQEDNQRWRRAFQVKK
jgi:ABC-type polysaccharide/polyol phosphate transport system ATPase subunit